MKRGRTRSKERGAAAVEFALVAPILFAVIIGTVEFGSAWSSRAQLNNAAMASVRSYTINQNVGTRNAPITAIAPGLTASCSPSVPNRICWEGASSGTCPTVQDNSLTPVKVTVYYNKPTTTRLFGTTIRVKAMGTARCN